MRVALAMSGGVDSSVAAWLLGEAGHDVVGLFMRRCPSVDPADARRVAERLGIPLHVLDFEAEFDRVIAYFVDEYAAGRTPNPCVVCNAWLKFGALLEHAARLGAERLATGHYVRLGSEDDGKDDDVALCRARDAAKDQSYMLFGIDRGVLGRLMFPVGEHSKEEIRRIAARLGLDAAAQRDSQEICFVPDRDHARFVRQHLGGIDNSGEVVLTDGTVVGRHDGIERFTVGQRKGLRIALGKPYFVVRIEPDTRRVVLGARDELARRELTADGANWLIDPPAEPFRCQVKIRYRSRPVAATVEVLSRQRFHVRFDAPCHAIAPGQAAVCYDGDWVLGGGWIEGLKD